MVCETGWGKVMWHLREWIQSGYWRLFLLDTTAYRPPRLFTHIYLAAWLTLVYAVY